MPASSVRPLGATRGWRATIVAVVSSVVVLGGAGPASAELGITFDAGVAPVTSVGGSGGFPFSRTDCPTATIATGVRASVAENDALWATVFSLECRALDATGTALDPSPQFTVPARGNPLSAVPGSEQAIECPVGQVLTGLQAYATTEPPLPWSGATTPPIITETFPRCRALDLTSLVPVVTGATTQVSTPLTAGGPATEAQLPPADCPDGQFIVGFGGREGWAVDKFEPYCGVLRVSGLTVSLDAATFAMPVDAVTLSASRTGGTTVDAPAGVAQRVWPGDYTATAVVPGLDPAWYGITPCTVTLAHSEAKTCAVTLTGRPDMAVALDGPSEVVAGSRATIGVTVANLGPGAAPATVGVVVPVGMTFGALPTGCSAAGTSATCTTTPLAGATIAGGQGGTLRLALDVLVDRAAAPGALTLRAHVGASGDGIAADDDAERQLEIEPPPPGRPGPAALTGGRAGSVTDGAVTQIPVPDDPGDPAVAAAITASGQGAWAVTADGHVATTGDAQAFGSVADGVLHAAVVAIAPTPTGAGYVLASADGGVYAFGDAAFAGSVADLDLTTPIVWAATTCSGHGYYLVAADGGVFAFGDAQFHGTMSGHHLNGPVVGLVPLCDNSGYWLVAADGGVFAFGGAPFFGSLGAQPTAAPTVGIVAPDNQGYWLLDSTGAAHAFGEPRSNG